MGKKKYLVSRKAPRLDISAIPGFKRAYIGRGTETKIVNISRGGALIENQEPITQGSRVSLRIVTTDKVYPIGGRILRCNVYKTFRTTTYHCAIAFDEEIKNLLAGEAVDPISPKDDRKNERAFSETTSL